MPQHRRHQLDGMCAGHHRLDHVERTVDSAARGELERGPLSGQDREPAQAQEELGGIGEVVIGPDLQLHDVDVGLVEAVEQHESICARRLELGGEVRQRGEEGRQLHGDRDRDRSLDRAHDLQRAPLDRDRILERIARDVVRVELERVGPCLLDHARVVEPARGRDAVE